MFCATGTLRENKPILRLFDNMYTLEEYLDKAEGSAVEREYENLSIVHLPPDIPQKHEVPINYAMPEKLRWFEGLVDGNARVLKTSSGNAIELTCAYIQFLLNVKRMLNTMGIDPKIGSSFKQVGFRLTIGPIGVAKLVALGLSPRRVSLELLEVCDVSEEPQKDARRSIVVTDVSNYGRRDDTYCYTEPLEGKGVFNGILAGNCAEITQYSDDKEYAVCNLASISIPKHVDPKTNTIDHATLHETARQITYNLNRLIDMNDYPTPKADVSNKALRPIGIGLQGLGDVYCMLKLPYDSKEALQIDEEVMETIYHGAMTASVELAIAHGPYPRFQGSPASKGQLQMDLWGHNPVSGRYDWDAMRAKVVEHGLRNSMLTALMPTASTSQVLGNCESFEPFQSNVFKRTTMAGEFLVVNRHLMKDLMAAGLWSDELRKELVQQDGSLQNIEGVPDDLKRVYATVWDVPQRAVIDHAAARGPYVDQSQSMNLYMQSPSFQKLSRALIYAWQKGLKTGLYYLRSAPAKEAVKYGGIKRAAAVTANANAEVVDVSDDGPSNTPDVEIVACKLRRAGDDGEVCEMCSA
jgi:ribonucleotide reductase alpha subunit